LQRLKTRNPRNERASCLIGYREINLTPISLRLTRFEAIFAFETDPQKCGDLPAENYFFRFATGHFLMKTVGQSLAEINNRSTKPC
jgi:hypothetical protein